MGYVYVEETKYQGEESSHNFPGGHEVSANS